MAETLLLSIGQVQKALGLGRDATYSLVRTGRIRSVRVGQRLLVPRAELESWLAREVEEGRAP